MRGLALAGSLVLAAASAPAQTEGDATAPISAIDWLSDSLSSPSGAPTGDSPVTQGIVTEEITVEPLDAPSPDGVGLLPHSVTGLPPDLWGSSELHRLAQLIAAFPPEPLPAVQDQFRRLMLAELEPPQGSTPKAPLLQTRVDALLARGAVDEAEALLERAGSTEPELFRRAFDVGLLTGREQAACARMRAVPGISPSFPVRIFCLARTGDWPAAALTLESANALGQLSPEEDSLLAQFLDPELSELLPPISAPRRPSPLTFRMMEAIGEPMPTSPLPLAFAHSDLRPTAGWKARVEAAERLARAGALPPEVLLSIYGERRPAASGGTWDRVGTVQTLSRAIRDEDIEGVATTLPETWEHMRAAGLTLPLARALGPDLAALPLEGEANGIATTLGLLSDTYESVALALPPSAPSELLVAAGLARGQSEGAPDGSIAAALAAAFADPAPALPTRLSDLAERNRLGEALLLALQTLAPGAEADPGDITGALAFLRDIGLEDTARRAALQILLLEPRG
ncbi:hypothetical protein CLV78_1011079 [Aliiruegeria haliotis]|uniref:Antifreeze glycopeptide polyprotein n=1 Tax=Aliiruegeria haliotis TaxID=1280846 RepID=A0A2T0S103_9RHOB|nr:hypothetical protein [Aliiruegeria haliotis]PRY26973.1 hypothetical protein CLV78_1011079 [Aliiruegeria haliotis]